MTFRIYFEISEQWQNSPLEIGGAIMAYVYHELGHIPECNYWKEGGKVFIYLRYGDGFEANRAYYLVRYNAHKGPFNEIILKTGYSSHRRIAYPTNNPYKDRIIELSGAAIISWIEAQPLRRKSYELSAALDNLGFLKKGQFPPAN